MDPGVRRGVMTWTPAFAGVTMTWSPAFTGVTEVAVMPAEAGIQPHCISHLLNHSVASPAVVLRPGSTYASKWPPLNTTSFFGSLARE